MLQTTFKQRNFKNVIHTHGIRRYKKHSNKIKEGYHKATGTASEKKNGTETIMK